MRRRAGASRLLLVLALLAAATVGARCSLHARRLLIRPFPGVRGTLACRNTLTGPFMYADDNGMLCSGEQLDFKTGCCRDGDKHACSACDAHDQCCEGYEACVSCCLKPQNDAKARLAEVTRIPGLKSSGTWRDAFELCAAVCRTHRTSTSHENSYISPRHHCFSRLGKPLLSPPLPANALRGVTVTLGAPGASCDSACQQAGGAACSATHLPLLDTCDRLREAVACEAGCGAEEHLPLMPYYADGDAPKADRPALCVVGVGGGRAPAADGQAHTAGNSSYTCAASRDHMRRLCPCAGGAGSGAPPAPAAASGTPQTGSSREGTLGAAARKEDEQQAAEEVELPGDEEADSGGETQPQQQPEGTVAAEQADSGASLEAPASKRPARDGSDEEAEAQMLEADAAEDSEQGTGSTARLRAARRRLLEGTAPGA